MALGRVQIARDRQAGIFKHARNQHLLSSQQPPFSNLRQKEEKKKRGEQGKENKTHTIVRIRARERHQVLVAREHIALARDRQLRALRVMLGREQLDHDDLVADEVVSRTQVLGDAQRPAVVGERVLVPAEAAAEVARAEPVVAVLVGG